MLFWNSNIVTKTLKALRKAGESNMRITLKAARVNKGLTQQEVANHLNVTKKTVCSWEKGKTLPRFEKIEPLCSLYGLTYEDIAWNG